MTDFIKELKAGKEIVVISNDKHADSAIFFINWQGKLMSWSRSIGLAERTDLTFERLGKHLYKYATTEGQVFVRGYRD